MFFIIPLSLLLFLKELMFRSAIWGFALYDLVIFTISFLLLKIITTVFLIWWYCHLYVFQYVQIYVITEKQYCLYYCGNRSELDLRPEFYSGLPKTARHRFTWIQLGPSHDEFQWIQKQFWINTEARATIFHTAR